MTYKELLLSENWQNKRREILKRDLNCCSLCNNSTLLKFESSYAFFDRRNSNGKRIIFKLNNNQDISISIDSFKVNGIFYQHILIFYELINNVFFKPVAGRRLKSTDQIPDLTKPAHLINDEWIFFNKLHVHHKFYDKSKLPWEYPYDAFQTLCWECHEKLHQNFKIPVYDSQKIIDYLTPCKRCNGAGEFPEYYHVENGICFECNGAKYQELIK